MAAGIPPGTAKAGTGDITGVTPGDGLSGGGTDGGVTVTLDLNELTAAAVADGDFIPIIDTNDSNGSRKEAVADLATLFAGDGLVTSSSVLAVNVDDSTIETSSDALRIKDNGVSLAKMAGLTRGSIIYGNASGNPTALAKGSADYVLTSDGTDIAWAAASAGAVTALNNATANEIVTVGSTTTELDAESTLTFASSKLIPTATAHNAAGTALTMSAGATTAGTTNNIAGGALTFQGGQGKGSGAGGNIVFQTANAAGSGSSLNALATALTLSDDLSATFSGNVTVADGTNDLNIASHDGTNGLALAGTVVTATAAQINVLTGATAGTSVVSKAVVLDSNGDFEFQDSDVLAFGDGGDLQITHTGSESSIKDLGDGVLNIDSNGTGIHLRKSDGEAMATFLTDGAVTLYHDNAAKLATSAAGVSVTGNAILGDGGNLNISTPLLAGADHTTTGMTAEMLAGAAIAAFNVVCIHTTTQEVIVADASAYATARAIGIAPAAISDTATGTVLLQGFIRDDTWNWTTGSTLYLSETAGTMTHTAPTTDGAFVVAIGVALEPDVVYINPSPAVIEVA